MRLTSSVFCAVLLLPAVGGWAAGPDDIPPAPTCEAADPDGATIEINLAKQWRSKAREIKVDLQSAPTPVAARVEFTPFLKPPTNIGIGRCIEASVARHAIEAAKTYNGGVTHLVFQEILPHRWVLIGTTQVAELSWVAITPQELEQLLDPALSTDAFQTLYRDLATPKERKRPFGFDPVPTQPPSR